MHIVLVDDHPLFREALRHMLQSGLPRTRIEEADCIEAARTVLREHSTLELILLDLTMKGVNGFDGLMSLRIAFPRIPILVVSGLDEPRIIREALRLGAAGFVPKSSGKATYLDAIGRVMDGAIFVPDLAGEPAPLAECASDRIATLTPAQMNVLTMIKHGKINKQIAHELGIGDSMVKAHVSEIMRKLGVRNRTQAALCVSSLDYDRVGL